MKIKFIVYFLLLALYLPLYAQRLSITVENNVISNRFKEIGKVFISYQGSFEGRRSEIISQHSTKDFNQPLTIVSGRVFTSPEGYPHGDYLPLPNDCLIKLRLGETLVIEGDIRSSTLIQCHKK